MSSRTYHLLTFALEMAEGLILNNYTSPHATRIREGVADQLLYARTFLDGGMPTAPEVWQHVHTAGLAVKEVAEKHKEFNALYSAIRVLEEELQRS